MSFFHIFLGILTAASWGINFSFIKLGLNELPPLLLCGLRFLFVSIPRVFFLKMPKVPFKDLLIYSFLTFTIQFSLLFLSLELGMPAGASSLVFQIQIFISLFIAAVVFNERPNKLQIIGGIIAFIGIGFVWIDINEPTTMLGLLVEIIAAASWAVGNIYSKRMSHAGSYNIVAWGCLFATPPLFLLSLIFEGPSQISNSLNNATWISVISVAYTTYISTGFGYYIWNKLLKIYPVSTIIPFTLLILGILCAMLVFDEKLSNNKIIASLLIIFGLGVNVFSNKIQNLRKTIKLRQKNQWSVNRP